MASNDNRRGDDDETDDLVKLERHPSFEPVICCERRFGVVNTRPFTPEAGAKFEAIRRRHVSAEDPQGNGWQDDPAARALFADPASCAPIPDGHRYGLSCPTCGAAFVQTNGKPTKVPQEIC